jgi:hypothetical protein
VWCSRATPSSERLIRRAGNSAEAATGAGKEADVIGSIKIVSLNWVCRTWIQIEGIRIGQKGSKIRRGSSLKEVVMVSILEWRFGISQSGPGAFSHCQL